MSLRKTEQGQWARRLSCERTRENYSALGAHEGTEEQKELERGQGVKSRGRMMTKKKKKKEKRTLKWNKM